MTPQALAKLGEHDSVRVIASGGMGVVLEVRNRRTGASYAAKVILRAQDVQARERFRREAELLARCDAHPGIVKVHMLGETAEGSLYMILDLVRGESLEALLKREGCLEARRAAALALGVANALGFVHERGILHRDVKPSNVLIDANETPRLTDFGLATARDVERLTVTGVFLGTLHYAAPEQAAGTKATAASDVFGLGCVLFHALAGTTPLDAATSLELMARLADDEPLDDVRTRVPGVPESLAAIVGRAVAKDPAERYENGNELARDLERFLSGGAVTYVPARRRRRQGMLLLTLVVLAAVALATVAIALLLGRRERASEARAAEQDELARARSLVARPNASAAEIAQAHEHLRRAIEAGERAGADRDEADVRALAVVRADLGVADASGALARGNAAAALAAIDALPGPQGSRADPARWVRARSLVALGRTDEAIREVEGKKEPEALELVGDARMVEGRPAEAEACYARALAAAGADASRFRAKRGGAAALAGDGPTADADVTALLGDLTTVPTDRATIAAIASIAPALYRRGLAATRPQARSRDLDAAWRLGRPPAALVAPVVAVLMAEAADAATAWVGRNLMKAVTDADLAQLDAIFVLAGRAHVLDPHARSVDLDHSLGYVEGIFVQGQPTSRIETIARRFLALDPDEPYLLYARAWAARATPARTRREPLEGVYRALTAILATPGDGPDRRLYNDAVVLAFEFLRDEPGLPADEALLRRGAEASALEDSWIALAEYLGRTRETPDEALACYAKAESLPKASGNETELDEINERRVYLLTAHGRIDDAVAAARAFHERDPSSERSEGVLVATLEEAGRWEELLAVAGPSRPAVVALALSKLGRTAEAHALVAKLADLEPPSRDLVVCRTVIAECEADASATALLAAGKDDEALDLLRRLVKPGSITAVRLLATALNRCGRPAEVLTLVGPDEFQRLRLYERGLAQVKLGDLAGARDTAAHLRRRGHVFLAQKLEALIAAAGKPR